MRLRIRKPNKESVEGPHTRETLKRMVHNTLFQVEAFTKIDKILMAIILSANIALLGAALFIALKAVVAWSLTMWVPSLILVAFSILAHVTMNVWSDKIQARIQHLDHLVPNVLRASNRTRTPHTRIVSEPVPA